MTTETMKNDEETEKAQDISVSTLKNTSIAEPHKDATANVSSVEKKLEKLMVEPATTEAQVRRPTPAVSGDSSESTKEEKPSSSSWTNPILRNNKNPTTDTHPGRSRRLEAYVLQPGVEPSKDGIIWSSKVIPLNLDETAVRAHLSKLGPEYSIINTICELLPAQLVVLQEQAQNRNGRLVSVQCSTPADIVTTMGIIKISSVVFIIAIASDDVPAGPRSIVKASEVKPSTSSFTSPQPFRPYPNNNNNDLFFGAACEENGRPGNSDMRPCCTQNSDGLTSHAYRPIGPVWNNEENPGALSYRDYLNPREEILEHYMTITAQELYGSNPPSLEELRVSDYAVGHTKHLPLEPRVRISSKPDTSKPFSDKKPFGGQYVNPNASANAPTAPTLTSFA